MVVIGLHKRWAAIKFHVGATISFNGCYPIVKIASYNINGINGRIENLLRWLSEAEPDVVCLQELKCDNNRFPEQALLDIGYNAIWHGQKSWNGVAFFPDTKLKKPAAGWTGKNLTPIVALSKPLLTGS
jgi:hypothetical protein